MANGRKQWTDEGVGGSSRNKSSFNVRGRAFAGRRRLQQICCIKRFYFFPFPTKFIHPAAPSVSQTQVFLKSLHFPYALNQFSVSIPGKKLTTFGWCPTFAKHRRTFALRGRLKFRVATDAAKHRKSAKMRKPQSRIRMRNLRCFSKM